MVLVVIAFILWGAYVCWTGYWGFIVNHRVPVIDLGMQVAILWWLLDTVLTKTVYRLEKDRLYMLKTGVGHKKELSIPYEDIFGVHHFKNQLMKPVTYRYTFHEYAKLDNRPIWSLLYDIGSDKKVGRVLMKASEEFWKEFERRMPGQIRIPQEEVVTFTYKAMEKKLRDQGYFKEHPEMSFEEGIKQLRQKGTEMGAVSMNSPAPISMAKRWSSITAPARRPWKRPRKKWRKRKKREKNSLHGSTCFGQVLFAAFRDDGAAGFLSSFMQRIGEIGV